MAYWQYWQYTICWIFFATKYWQYSICWIFCNNILTMRHLLDFFAAKYWQYSICLIFCNKIFTILHLLDFLQQNIDNTLFVGFFATTYWQCAISICWIFCNNILTMRHFFAAKYWQYSICWIFLQQNIYNTPFVGKYWEYSICWNFCTKIFIGFIATKCWQYLIYWIFAFTFYTICCLERNKLREWCWRTWGFGAETAAWSWAGSNYSVYDHDDIYDDVFMIKIMIMMQIIIKAGVENI